MKTKHLLLAGAMALAAGMGLSVSATAKAGPACERFCSTKYTQCRYSCTPGNGACYDMCHDNYDACVDEMCG